MVVVAAWVALAFAGLFVGWPSAKEVDVAIAGCLKPEQSDCVAAVVGIEFGSGALE